MRTIMLLFILSPRIPPGTLAIVLTRLNTELNKPIIATTAASSRRNSLTRYGMTGPQRESAKHTINIITHNKTNIDPRLEK